MVKRKMIYRDETKDETTIPINEHYYKTFCKILLENGYSVRIKGNGTDVDVTIGGRRE